MSEMTAGALDLGGYGEPSPTAHSGPGLGEGHPNVAQRPALSPAGLSKKNTEHGQPESVFRVSSWKGRAVQVGQGAAVLLAPLGLGPVRGEQVWVGREPSKTGRSGLGYPAPRGSGVRLEPQA